MRRVRSYTLVEMLIVLGILGLLMATSIPNFFGQNERFVLDNSANQLRQVLIEAQTRSLAPQISSSQAGAAQYYQVTLGDFKVKPADSTGLQDNTAYGDQKTTSVSLAQGNSECGVGDIGAQQPIRNYKLPKLVYVASFFPFTTKTTDTLDGFVRFTLGKAGYQCGATTGNLAESTDFANGSIWSGTTPDGSKSFASYMTIELKTANLSESRFVTIDRSTGQISVQRSNPNAYFKPVADILGPAWPSNGSARLTVSCRQGDANLSLNFSRATDQVSDATGQATADSTRAVYYDINWKTVGGTPQPLAVRLANPASGDANYFFSSKLISLRAQPPTIQFQLSTYDQNGNLALLANGQPDYKILTFNRGIAANNWVCRPGNGVEADVSSAADGQPQGSQGSVAPDNSQINLGGPPGPGLPP
jgi:type II secretory pathway pseudopilin PulG